MKKMMGALAIAALVTGCATPMPVGGLYWEGKIPLDAEGDAGGKTGKACMTSVLSLIATGDASIAAAKANGNISKVSTVDFEAKNILGIYGTHCTIVTGN
ncbi:MAG: hypothetical protein A2V90_01445 [Gammaproteobacteria bacterium RBG_16_57_12]|nr:MAG: hypothetical protein A2V90_01445 [Gammaproteobacteria bacterium RBG_16_57_12]